MQNERKSKNEIISILYTLTEVNETIRKIIPPEYREDVKQEIFVSLCKQTPIKIQEMYYLGNPIAYIATACRNHLCEIKRNIKLITQPYIEETHADAVSIDGEGEQITYLKKLQLYEDLVEELPENTRKERYSKQVLKLYLQEGSCYKLGKLTGIHRKSINRNILYTKHILIQNSLKVS